MLPPSWGGAGGCGRGQEPLEAPLQAVPQLLQLSGGGPVDPQHQGCPGVGVRAVGMGAGPLQRPDPWPPPPQLEGQQGGGHTEAVPGFEVEPFGAKSQFLQGLCCAVGQMPSWTATTSVQLQALAWDQVGAGAHYPHPYGLGTARQDRSCPCYTRPQRRTEQR